jgi:RNA polymerase sigma factor (sigma-70 family)
MFRARGCTPEEAADLAQDAAVRAFVHIRRWGVASGGLDPLLNRIARNLLIDRYRRASPHLVPLDSAQELHDPEQDPTEEVARRQRRRAVHHAIRRLPSRHQSAINYSLSGMTPEEVGMQLGIGRNAADALLHRARRSLKEHLAPVRDGMWGLALAVRVRYDRVTRRASLGGVAGDASGALASSVAAGIATAVVVVAMSVGGGGSGAGGSIGGPGVAQRVPASIVGQANAANGASGGMSGSGAVAGDMGAGNSTASTFTFGPTTTTNHGNRGVSNDMSIPDPSNENGPQLLQIQQYLGDGTGAPPDDEPDMVSATLCMLGPAPCALTELRP